MGGIWHPFPLSIRVREVDDRSRNADTERDEAFSLNQLLHGNELIENYTGDEEAVSK